jgi:protein SCO1/2
MKFILPAIVLILSCSKTDPVLPFYQSSDFSPEWIKPSDSKFSRIHTIANFELSDQFGAKVSEAALDGKITVSNFFFTTCPGICKDLTSNMGIIQKNFKRDADVQMISISVTPEIDTISVLENYAIQNNVGKNWRLLTGDRKTIYTLARYSFFADTEFDKEIDERSFLHSENFLLLDKKRRIRGVYNGTLAFDMQRLSEDIRLLKKEA